MAQGLLNYYFTASKYFSKSIVTWKQLARVDQPLTSKWVDKETVSSHKILIKGEEVHNDDITSLYKFLDDEFGFLAEITDAE